MTQEVLSLLGILAVILLVLGGSYLFTRWAGVRLGGGLFPQGGSGRMRLLDRLPLGKDQQLLVAQVGRRCFLLASSPAGLTLLAELSAEEGEQWRAPPPSDAPQERRTPDFGAMLQRLREKNTNEKR